MFRQDRTYWVDTESGESAGVPLFARNKDPFWGAANGHDPYFGLPLWLRATCCGGHTLWAYNEEHLDFLEQFIKAKLRERWGYGSPRATLTWKLPKWMKQAHNRAELTRTIEHLRATLP